MILNAVHKRYVIFVSATIFLLIAFFYGCATFKQQPDIYVGPHVKVIIKPDMEKIQASSIGIFNFSHTTNLDNLGYALAQFSQKELLTRRFVKLIELTGTEAINVEDAIGTGRERGYDLILLGKVIKFFHGGVSYTSKVAVSIKIIDVKTGATLWFITGRMEGRYLKHTDYLLFSKPGRETPSPMVMCTLIMNKLLEELTTRSQG